MRYRCPDSTVAGIGTVEGFGLLFKGGVDHAYATIEPRKDSRIPVLVWGISEKDEQRLDCYEGYPRLYYKKEILVEVNGEQKKAMVYIMDERNPLNQPSDEYYQILEETYLKYCFDNTVLYRAKEESCPENRTMEDSKKEIDKLFEKIMGHRFYNFDEIEQWFRQELKSALPELIVRECDGINDEIGNKQTQVDFSTDCTFGKNIFGFSNADFSIDYILDNENQMYVTYARWN